MAAIYKALSRQEKNKEDTKSNGPTIRKELRQRVLILTSRGVTFRHRHLLADLSSMLPHSHKESKLDTKTKLHQLNELADLYNCNNVLYFEARKGKDLYAWMSKPPNGPTVKFHVQNLHTMDELHFTGNCLKGSRPILSFDASFDTQPHLTLIKELMQHTFGVPPGARKSKPFVDHIMGFTAAGGRIWIRCYQINEADAETKKAKNSEVADTKKSKNAATPALPVSQGARGETSLNLIEIGPRFVLTPIVILESSFGGPVIYENKEFVSPNQVRSDILKKKAGKYNARTDAHRAEQLKRDDLGISTGGRKAAIDPLDNRVLFR